MRYLRLLCLALFPSIFLGCTYAATHTEVNQDFFKNPADLHQKFSMIRLGMTEDQILGKLGLKGDQLDSIEQLGPDDIYKYMCGSPYNSCVNRKEFSELSGIRIPYVDTTKSVTVNPSVSATVHDRGHNQTIVAIFQNGKVVQPYAQGIAAIHNDQTIYIMDLIGSTFRDAVTTGTTFGVKSAF